MKKRMKKKKKKAEEAKENTIPEMQAEEQAAQSTEEGGEAAIAEELPADLSADEIGQADGAKEDASPLDSLRPGERAALIAALATRMRREEEENALAELAGEAGYTDIAEYAEEMRALPARFPFLATLPTKERLTAAYHMCRGLAATPRTTEEKLEALLTDSALLTALSERFSRLLAARRDATPPVPVRSGTAVPPADRRPSPRDLREASVAAKRYLGIQEN